ncbi:hypothetical protein Ndes2437A_g09170 [Nannochloris sp. 'desiccata']
MLTLKIHITPKGWIKPPSRARCIAQASSNAASPVTHPLSLLQWLVTTQGASPLDLKVERTFRGEDLGYGLIATQEINPEDTILSVPLSSALTSEGASETEWSIHMAENILRVIKHGENTPWLDSLPKNINLPWLYWSSEEVAEFQELDTINEAYNLRTVFDTAVQRLCSGGNGNGNTAQYRPAEVAYALSLVHSRSFLSSGVHVWVPGVDLCNHNGEKANATVRCIHNPDVCQGSAATEEIAPPQVNSTPRPSIFELVAGEQGIQKGEEVTISVIAQGTGVEAESIDPIKDTDSRKQWYTELSKELSAGGEEEEGAVSVDIENDYTRMVLTPSGIDYRLLEGVGACLKLFVASTLASGAFHDVESCDAHKIEKNEEFLQALNVPILIATRCQQVLAGFSTSLEDDEKAVETTRGNYKTALEYRIGKKRILHSALAHFRLQSE